VAAGRKESIELEAAITQAESSASMVSDTIQDIRSATDQLLDAGARLASASSETIGGVVGTAVGLAGAALIVITIPAISVSAPFLLIGGAIIGMGSGVLGFRGRKAVQRERELRDDSLRLKAIAERAEFLRQEIDKAQLANAPVAVVSSLWSSYQEVLFTVGSGTGEPPLLSPPKPQLALPPKPGEGV
jgi:F0F1-type ATP synthase assembly protein I